MKTTPAFFEQRNYWFKTHELSFPSFLSLKFPRNPRAQEEAVKPARSRFPGHWPLAPPARFEVVDWIRVGTVGGFDNLCGGVAIAPGSSTQAAALWIARSGSSRVRVYSRGIQVPPPALALARVAQQSSCSGLRTPLEWWARAARPSRPPRGDLQASRPPALGSRYWPVCWSFAAGPGRFLGWGSAPEGLQLWARVTPGLPDPSPTALTSAATALARMLRWTVWGGGGHAVGQCREGAAPPLPLVGPVESSPSELASGVTAVLLVGFQAELEGSREPKRFYFWWNRPFSLWDCFSPRNFCKTRKYETGRMS